MADENPPVQEVIMQTNSYYDPEPKNCPDERVPHGEHVYMEKTALGLRTWYSCVGFSLEEELLPNVDVEGPNV